MDVRKDGKKPPTRGQPTQNTKAHAGKRAPSKLLTRYLP
jgi:hypothetical protein